MWQQVKSTRNNIILLYTYHDFSSIEVERKTNSKGLSFYEINFHIEDVTDQSVVCYNIDDVKNILIKAKEIIEDLYEDIVDMTNEDLYQWLDCFVEEINDF